MFLAILRLGIFAKHFMGPGDMPSYLDLGVLAVVLISALLSMVRGFTREVLAIGSWAAAALAALYFYPYVLPYVTPYIHKEIIAQGVAAAVVFFVTLIIVSLFTVRLSDAILDSKIGALDRSLGFLFGAARGFLLGVIAFFIFSWLVAEKQQPEWVKTAKTRPVLQQTAERIIAILPADAAATIEGWVKAKTAAAADEPADENAAAAKPTTPAKSDPATSAPASPSPPKKPDPSPSGAAATDKQKLDAILNKTVSPTPKP